MKYALGIVVSCLALAACELRPADDSQATPDVKEPVTPRPAASVTDASNSTPPPAGVGSVNVGGLATCEPTASVNTAIERMAHLADSNGDGEVSRSEATALANFALGGVFFRADANGDGTVTPEEGREVRKELIQRYPELEAVVLAARASGQKSFTLPVSGTDVEYGKPLTIGEVRAAAKSLVDDLFGFADKNKNNSIALDEARSAGRDGVRALGRTAFTSMDSNKDGALNYDELKQLVDAPLHQAFQLADSDHDQRLTMDEVTAALSLLSRTVGIPRGSGQTSAATAAADTPATK
jgi:EF hand